MNKTQLLDCVGVAVVELMAESSGLGSTKWYNFNNINQSKCNIKSIR